MTELRLALTGDCGAGKSCLAYQLQNAMFLEDIEPTIEETVAATITLDGESIRLVVTDSASQYEFFDAMKEEYIKHCSGFVLVYSITSRDSFKAVQSYHNRILRMKDTIKVPIVLAGAKCDLRDSREVSIQEGEDLARSLDCPFFETSAKNRVNVEECFYSLARAVLKEMRPESSAKPKKKKKEEKECLIM